jgi:hypothetical protein
MQEIQPWVANNRLAAEEIRSILRNRRVHNSPTKVPILSQINPALVQPSHFFKICTYVNIIFSVYVWVF